MLFSRNPLTGEPAPYGEWLPRAQGEDVVSGKFTPQPLAAMQGDRARGARRPARRRALRSRPRTRDVQDIEFTVERGAACICCSRAPASARRAAAVRIAVDMVDEGLIDEATALSARHAREQLTTLLAPRLVDPRQRRPPRRSRRAKAPARASGIGVVVTDSDEAERRAAAGEDVVLARPTTSPEDVHGMIAARAIVTEHGGSTSHAAVVSRSLGRPCVVGCGEGALSRARGRIVTVDGALGEVHDGRAAAWSAPDEERAIRCWGGSWRGRRIERSAMSKVTPADVESLVELFDRSDWKELHLELEGFEIHLVEGSDVAQRARLRRGRAARGGALAAAPSSHRPRRAAFGQRRPPPASIPRGSRCARPISAPSIARRSPARRPSWRSARSSRPRPRCA